MTLKIKDGWIPGRMGQEDNGSPYLELAHIEDKKLMGAFIRFDLERSNIKTHLPLDILLQEDKFSRQSIMPAGFIFHLSRCGSTLLSEMFRTLPRVKVVAEPMVIGQLFQILRGDEGSHVVALQNLIGMYQQSLCKDGERLIFKFSSWNAMAVKIFQMAFPTTPCIFLYRDPFEIMISMLGKPPAWLSRDLINRVLAENKKNIHRNLSKDMFSKMLFSVYYSDDISNTELFSRALGEICKSILNAPQSLLLMDYRSLPDAMPDKIAPFFDVSIEGAEFDRVMKTTQTDIKSYGRKNEFLPDFEIKQKAITAEIRQAVERNVLPRLDIIKRMTSSVNN